MFATQVRWATLRALCPGSRFRECKRGRSNMTELFDLGRSDESTGSPTSSIAVSREGIEPVAGYGNSVGRPARNSTIAPKLQPPMTASAMG